MMTILHPEHYLWRRFGEHGKTDRRAEPGAGQPRAKRAHDWPYLSRRERWMLAGVLLAAAGWIVFQFLVTLVTLD
jgi:hypothetical protein